MTPTASPSNVVSMDAGVTSANGSQFNHDHDHSLHQSTSTAAMEAPTNGSIPSATANTTSGNNLTGSSDVLAAAAANSNRRGSTAEVTEVTAVSAAAALDRPANTRLPEGVAGGVDNDDEARIGERRFSSLDMRRLPTDILLRPSKDVWSDFESTEDDDDDLLTPPGERELSTSARRGSARTSRSSMGASKTTRGAGNGAASADRMDGDEATWNRALFCLSPKYTLKTQLMLSFGIVNLFTISSVVMICILAATLVGEKVKTLHKQEIEHHMAEDFPQVTTRYLAETLQYHILPVDLVDILIEGAQDRFSGYPNPTDDEVPFPDTIQPGRNIYPVIGDLMPLDWQVKGLPLVDDSNYREHMQQSLWDSFYGTVPIISTANAVFLLPGACDPSERNPLSPLYWEDCSSDNNNLTVGGLRKSPTTSLLHRKGSDLVPLLKAIFESHQEVQDLGIYFSNSGGGATMFFPAYPSLDTNTFYPSDGCTWMLSENPIDASSGTIGTQEEIERCSPSGQDVSNRLYNPLERSWCRKQALSPHQTFIDVEVNRWNPGTWFMSMGRALYDRQSKAFIGCTAVSISLASIDETLRDALLTKNSELSLVKYGAGGQVISSTKATRDHLYSDLTIDQLGVGLDQKTYTELYNLVDYTSTWNPQTARQAYEEFYVRMDGYFVSVSPLPIIPDSYEPLYKPVFFVVMSTSLEDVFLPVEKLNDDVTKQVVRLSVVALICGAIGLAAVTFVIIFMANALTSPLHYINRETDTILNNVGNTASGSLTANRSDKGVTSDDEANDSNVDVVEYCEADKNVVKKAMLGVYCTPKTELSDVLEEFEKMVQTFSGSLLAKSEKGMLIEVRNQFKLQKDFANLYASRLDPQFPYKLDVGVHDTDSQPERMCEDRGFIHIGSNLVEPPIHAVASSRDRKGDNADKAGSYRRRFSSRLFLWTVLLIVPPLILTSIGISAYVMHKLLQEFNASLGTSQEFFQEVKLFALSVHVDLRSKLLGDLVQVSVRDIYLVTRYFGWLFFGGVRRADSFTALYTPGEPCKTYKDNTACPYWQENYVCDCNWNDKSFDDCQQYRNGSRHLQLTSFTVEKSADSLPDGDRYKTSEPPQSQRETNWWNNVSEVPGWEKGSLAAGYDTLYDRLRVSSAMPLFPVLYNYNNQKDHTLGQFIGFEADGMMMGYRGCAGLTGSTNSNWNSTKANGGPEIRPELCPEGKYGYDARCRTWYGDQRRLAIEANVTIKVIAPYHYPPTNETAQGATAPLINPSNGEYVATIFQFFKSHSLYGALSPKNTRLLNGFPILIAVLDADENNIVIGPGFSINDPATAISRKVLPHDYNCDSTQCQNNTALFKSIESSMDEGENDTRPFTRSNENGEVENLFVAYAPVKVKAINPIDASNFARGMEVEEHVIYSLGLVEPEHSFWEPFERIKDTMDGQITLAVTILMVGIVLSALFTIYVSYLVTTSITSPMIYLLDLIRSINRRDFGADPPKIDRSVGSREIVTVSDTVLILYKIVRAANHFYFIGEHEMAHRVLVDALRMFRKLDNKKAMAVACNNLGNTMLAIYLEMIDLGLQEHCGLKKVDIIARGIKYYHDAITLGEAAYDEFYEAEGWTPSCLDFMQHLSNRYFNRALFLLMVKDDHEQPAEIEVLGLRDLEIARDMDFEIVEYGADLGFNRENRAHKLFPVGLVRSRGHNMLLERGYPDELMKDKGYPEDWELGERLDQCFKMLQAENHRRSSLLFEDMNVLGRLQELEAELIKYKTLGGDIENAARIAVRILVEDGMIFAHVLSVAVDALETYSKTRTADDSVARVKRELRGYAIRLDSDLESIEEETRCSTLAENSISADVASVLEPSTGSTRISRKTSNVNWAKKRVSGGFITMEDF